MWQAVLGIRGYVMKKCNKCGYILKGDQTFCNKCGTKWVDVEAIRKAEEEKTRIEKEERERLIAEREAIRKAEQEAAQEKVRLEKEERERLIAEREAIRKIKKEAAQGKVRLKKEAAQGKVRFKKEERERKIAEREVNKKKIKESIKNADIPNNTKKVLINLFIIFRWVCTAFFAVFALVMFSDSSIISGLSIVVVIYFSCPLNKKLDNTLKIHPTVKLLIAIMFFIIAIFSAAAK